MGAKVGIGTADPVDTLHVIGTVRISSLPDLGVPGTAVYFDGNGRLGIPTSDRRLKENIVTIDSALDKVCQMRGVNFNMKEDTSKTKSMGVIAQEIMEIVPEAVFSFEKNGDEYYGVHYAELTAILIEAMKDQNQKIEALELRLTELEKRLP